mmetsp:Transcript_22177/g.76831  ORF Transcript_22177/g.76831 Transcript_22177/m.76831 type:complete len:245 (-) Transcript_22177:39-773(-)
MASVALRKNCRTTVSVALAGTALASKTQMVPPWHAVRKAAPPLPPLPPLENGATQSTAFLEACASNLWVSSPCCTTTTAPPNVPAAMNAPGSTNAAAWSGSSQACAQNPSTAASRPRRCASARCFSSPSTRRHSCTDRPAVDISDALRGWKQAERTPPPTAAAKSVSPEAQSKPTAKDLCASFDVATQTTTPPTSPPAAPGAAARPPLEKATQRYASSSPTRMSSMSRTAATDATQRLAWRPSL